MRHLGGDLAHRTANAAPGAMWRDGADVGPVLAG